MFLRFGRVSNEDRRGFRVRGWNYIQTKTKGAYQKYCHKENSFADCFEKYGDVIKGNHRFRESGILNFFEVVGNYFLDKPSPQNTCGGSDTPKFNEDAQGVVCR